MEHVLNWTSSVLRRKQFVLLLLLVFPVLRRTDATSTSSSTARRNQHKPAYPGLFDVNTLGTRELVPNRTVFGAIILSGFELKLSEMMKRGSSNAGKSSDRFTTNSSIVNNSSISSKMSSGGSTGISISRDSSKRSNYTSSSTDSTRTRNEALPPPTTSTYANADTAGSGTNATSTTHLPPSAVSHLNATSGSTSSTKPDNAAPSNNQTRARRLSDTSTEFNPGTNKNTTTSRPLSAADIASSRLRHAMQMIAQLPFPVIYWPPVMSNACPYSPNQHKAERGLTLAHLQIWTDFVYFDHKAVSSSSSSSSATKGSPRIRGSAAPYNTTTSTNNSSMSDQHQHRTNKGGWGTYTVAENGTRFKNRAPFWDEDILVVFEDDADIAIPAQDVHAALQSELAGMHTDLLFLGWCEGRTAKPVPLCAHAYAVTRTGARKLIQHLESCGLALDEQFVLMGKNNWITYASAKNLANSKEYKGIFHQKKMGSLVGHKWSPAPTS